MYNKDLGVKTIDNDYIINERDVLVVGNKATAITVRLPAASGSGQVFYIKNIGAGNMTIVTDCTDTIDSSTSEILAQWEGLCIIDYSKGKWIKP